MQTGKYKRTYYQRRKASKTMKKVWANRRRSEAHKKIVADRKAAGIMVHTNGRPYKHMPIEKDSVTAHFIGAPAGMFAECKHHNSEPTLVEGMFGEGLKFADLTPSQRRKYWAAIDKRRTTKRTKKAVKQVIDQSRPIKLLVTITIEGNEIKSSVAELAPSQP